MDPSVLPSLCIRHFVTRLRIAVVLMAAGFSAAAGAAEPPAIDPLLGAPLSVRERPSFGPEDAAIVVIEVRSFKCAHCRAFHETVFPKLREKYIAPGGVRWVRINATPDAADVNAPVFALARCAMKQGAYDAIEDFLFRNGGRASSYLHSRAAQQPGIDGDALSACVRGEECRGEIAADFAEAAALKVKVLPTFILRKRKTDGTFVETRIEGYPQADYFSQVMDQLQAQP